MSIHDFSTENAARNVRIAFRKLAMFAAAIQPSTKFSTDNFEPAACDAKALQDDLIALAQHVDEITLAYGKLLRSNSLCSDKDVETCFTDQLIRALDGNALYVIEEGITRRALERAYA